MIRRKTFGNRKNRMIILVMLFCSITARCAKTSTAPKELTGIWKASDIRYSGTSFEINKAEITFQDKDGDRNSYTIIKIKKESMQDKDWVMYTLRYLDSNLQKVEFPFYFRSSDIGMIRFKHQPSLVWKKDT